MQTSYRKYKALFKTQGGFGCCLQGERCSTKILPLLFSLPLLSLYPGKGKILQRLAADV